MGQVVIRLVRKLVPSTHLFRPYIFAYLARSRIRHVPVFGQVEPASNASLLGEVEPAPKA